MFSFDSPVLANLLALISIILAIAIPLVGYLYNQRRGVRTHFTVIWQLTRFLPARKLLNARPYYELYLPSEADTDLQAALKQRQNVLVIGRPLSGKTRAVYQLLRRKFWHVTIPKTTDINSEVFEFPRRLRLLFWLRPVVVVDDLHRFVEQQNFDVLLRASMDRKIQMIATCRSGDDLKRTLNRLQAKGLEPSLYFPQHIYRQLIEKDIGQTLAKRLNLPWNSESFDGTVGSVLMKLGEMERRFEACSPEEKVILRSLQALYRCGIYQGEQRFPLIWIEQWAKTYELEGRRFEWTAWLESLQGKEFLQMKDEAVEAEEAYLETAVRSDVERLLLSLMEEALKLFKGEPDALNRLGNRAYEVGQFEYDDRAYLELGTAAYRQVLLEWNHKQDLQWASTQNSLGLALLRLGEREPDSQLLEKAVTAFQQALLAWTHEQVPLQWASTQNNLGTALSVLGARKSDSQLLEKAVAAYHQSLLETTRERMPLNWAATQNNLGDALRALGARESNSQLLERAVIAYQQALGEYTREHTPLRWASTQNNLGLALSKLGEWNPDSQYLEAAIVAFQQAMLERTRERVPLRWAGTQNNLGLVFLSLGEWKSDSQLLQAAITAFQHALHEYTRDRMPLDWAGIHNNLGRALLSLGKQKSDNQLLEAAIIAFQQALIETTQKRVPFDWAGTQCNLGSAFQALGERMKSKEHLEQAKQTIQSAHNLYCEAGYEQFNQGIENRLAAIDDALSSL